MISSVNTDRSLDRSTTHHAGSPGDAATRRGVHDRLATLNPDRVNSYRPSATLPLRVELTRQLTRRRTQIVIVLLAVLPLIVAAAFTFGGAVTAEPGVPQIVSLATAGGFNFTLFMLLVSTGFLLVVIVALFTGDTVASEASWSSLKYLLAQPVPRARLLRQKIAVAVGTVTVVIVLYTAWTLLVGSVFFGFRTTELPIGAPTDAWQAAAHLAVIVGYVCLQLAGTAAFAFFLSTCFDNPLGAVGGAVMLTVVSSILDQIAALGALRNALIGHWDYAWFDAVASPIRYDDMIQGIGVSLIYVAVFLGLAFIRFERKDITS